MRLFISIPLPEQVLREIIRIQNELRARNFFDGSFVKHENLHITVLFFGSVDDSIIPLISTQLAMLKAASCNIRLKTLDVNSHSKPHVLWVSVESAQLSILAEQLEQAFPLYKQERAFNGHITLARMRKVDKQKLKEALSEITVHPFEWRAKEYALQVSQTLPEGPLYTTLGIFTLEEIE
jgi:2'-5' RNA ligase